MIFILSFIMLLSLIAKEINKRFDIPYSSLILLVGFILSFFRNFGVIG